MRPGVQGRPNCTAAGLASAGSVIVATVWQRGETISIWCVLIVMWDKYVGDDGWCGSRQWAAARASGQYRHYVADS